MNLNPLRRCWVEIDLSAFRRNAAELRRLSGPDKGLMAVVKADAYGHGLEAVVSTLNGLVDWFCVANVREALRVRDCLPGNCPPILLLSPITPDECETALTHGFSLSVSSVGEVETYGNAAKHFKTKLKLHAVADTGMGRIGASPADWHPLLEAIRNHPACELEGVSTHFPNADENAEFTDNQIRIFRDLTTNFEGQIHLSNSAGIIDFSAQMPFATLTRPGLALYGTSPQCRTQANLTPALSMKTRITLIRDIAAGTTISYGSTFTADRAMTTASLAVGYGDGFPRHLSGQGAKVLIAGTRCPLLGRVTMDQIVVDVSHLDGLKPGDEVVLIGEQGSEAITASELAEKSGTIPWEIYTGISSRVERVYFDSENPELD